MADSMKDDITLFSDSYIYLPSELENSPDYCSKRNCFGPIIGEHNLPQKRKQDMESKLNIPIEELYSSFIKDLEQQPE